MIKLICTVVVCLLTFLSDDVVFAQTNPKLVVLLVVDQLRPDYADRFGPQLSAGLGRLLREGAVFEHAYHHHAATVTAAGHAAISTGLYPSHNGIIQNSWWDRGKKEVVRSIEDDRYPQLAKSSYGVSPLNMRGATLGDWLKAEQPQSQVVGISLKDRSAVLLAGKSADRVFWYSNRIGGFTTSQYYVKRLDSWVETFSQENDIKAYSGKTWQPLFEKAAYHPTDDLPVAYEGDVRGGWTATFPHVMPTKVKDLYKSFESTPWADQYTLAFAKKAVDELGLGQDDITDLLAVSLSATDLIGHKFGPDSMELHDQILRLDSALGDFIEFLEGRFGLQNVLIVLSSDHGVCPIPEHLSARGEKAMRINFNKEVKALNAALMQRYRTGPLIESYHEGMIYLDHKMLAENKILPEQIMTEVKRHFLNHPAVERIFTSTELMMTNLAADELMQKAQNSFDAGRSGDVTLIFKKFHLDSPYPAGTDHGSPYDYDAHVPLIFMGWSIPAGRRDNIVHTVDIAPSVAKMLNVRMIDFVDGNEDGIPMQLTPSANSSYSSGDRTR